MTDLGGPSFSHHEPDDALSIRPVLLFILEIDDRPPRSVILTIVALGVRTTYLRLPRRRL